MTIQQGGGGLELLISYKSSISTVLLAFHHCRPYESFLCLEQKQKFVIYQGKTFQGICINPKLIEKLISSSGDSPEGRQPEVPEPAKVTNNTSMYTAKTNTTNCFDQHQHHRQRQR